MRSATPGRAAPGEPGIEPRWTHGAKDAIGTAASSASQVWFTVHRGSLTEIFYPTLDEPQVRDVVFVVSDGATFVHDEKRHLKHHVAKMAPDALGFVVTSEDPDGRYRLVKEILVDPERSCLLVRLSLEPDLSLRGKLRLFVLIAPHLDGDGWGDRAYVTEMAGRPVLAAEGNETWMMAAANVPWKARSAGFVGRSDGWLDLMQNRRLTSTWDEALDGNVALSGELDLSDRQEFTFGLAFGASDQHAASTLFQALGHRWSEQKPRFLRQWDRAATGTLPLDEVTWDGGRLYRTSRAILQAHEDKTYPGAITASLSIPWGDVRGDTEIGGYHLVWTRDLYNSATGLLATGDLRTPLRSLIYLACTQNPDGGFYQNFWIDGRPYWTGVQLDEVSFPILLAYRLWKADALGNFDPWPMVRRAARYLVARGPITVQERWEENCGFSPSTLAASIAAMVCAAAFAKDRADPVLERAFLDWGDFLESHVEAWTVTVKGTLVPGISRHYIRIQPRDPAAPDAEEDADAGVVPIRNRDPRSQQEFAAKDVIDPGFLELVRLGVRRPGDPLIEDSLRVVDATLKVDLPQGPCWHRYNHDGYGEGPDGEPFQGWGVGRAWPLLTGERAHYELAAGRDVSPLLRAIEGFANEVGLLSEQLWDQPDSPKQRLRFGGPTGGAMPLCWAHAEYVKLVRSRADGVVFDRIAAVAERYLAGTATRRDLEVWKFDRQIRRIAAGRTLRWIAETPFVLRVTTDGWATERDLPSTDHEIGLSWVDLATAAGSTAPVQFTFLWRSTNQWEGRNFQVDTVIPRGY